MPNRESLVHLLEENKGNLKALGILSAALITTLLPEVVHAMGDMQSASGDAADILQLVGYVVTPLSLGAQAGLRSRSKRTRKVAGESGKKIGELEKNAKLLPEEKAAVLAREELERNHTRHEGPRMREFRADFVASLNKEDQLVFAGMDKAKQDRAIHNAIPKLVENAEKVKLAQEELRLEKARLRDALWNLRQIMKHEGREFLEGTFLGGGIVMTAVFMYDHVRPDFNNYANLDSLMKAVFFMKSLTAAGVGGYCAWKAIFVE